MVEPDVGAQHAVAQRAACVLRPAGALARLDQVAVWLAGWQRTDHPAVRRPAVLVFASDHGVVAEGVSAYPASVTAEVVAALRAGSATASVLAEVVGARLVVVDVGVGRPSANLASEPALSPERFTSCWDAGTHAVAGMDADLLVVGEVGIGNTTAAAAVAAVLCGGATERWVGRGSGVDDDGLARKVAAVERARRRVPAGTSPLEVLRHVGGPEMVAMAAAVVEARRRSVPVLLDGFVVTAAVLPLALAELGALDHCWAAHRSSEPGHGLLLDALGKQPLLELDLRLGEGSGGLLAMPLVRMAAAAVTEVATFEEWGLVRR